MSEEPCKLVLSINDTVKDHAEMFGSINQHLLSIDQAVGNGLSKELRAVKDLLNKTINEEAIRVIKIENENWFSRIISGNVRKIITAITLFIMLGAVANGATWLYLKVNVMKETPGQQLLIGTQQKTLMTGNYHTHILPDGSTLMHAGNRNLPAWIIKIDGTWLPAPTMRTEEGMK
jgi:hypothetical protein